MQLDVVFHGIAAPLRLNGAETVLPVLDRIAVGWPHRGTAADPEAIPFFSISSDPGGDRLVCESHAEGKGPRRFDAVNAVCDAMVGLALALPAEHPDLICLHAAAVAMAGRLLVFPNVQRAGKSTLSAALAQAGHALFSDDVVPLSFASDARARGHAMGIAPRLRLPLPEALGQGFRDWVEGIGGPRNRQYLYLSLPDLPPRGTVLPLGAFVILDRLETPVEARLELVGPEVAMDALLFQNFTRDRHSGDILRVMAAVLSDRPAYRLSYHDLDSAVACLERQFHRWPDPITDAAKDPEQSFRLADFATQVARGGQAGGRLLRQRPGTTEIWLGDRLYLADAMGRAIHRIDPVGAAVWLILAEPTTPDEIAALLAETFPEISRAQISADLQRLIAQFDANNLIQPAS
jgi:Coenzyme PQQ synthesis protein D (PqqD)